MIDERVNALDSIGRAAPSRMTKLLSLTTPQGEWSGAACGPISEPPGVALAPSTWSVEILSDADNDRLRRKVNNRLNPLETWNCFQTTLSNKG